MRIEQNRVSFENGYIEIEVNEGYGEEPSTIDFYLCFMWLNPEDFSDKVSEDEKYSTFEDAIDRYNELDKIVAKIIFKEV